LAEQSWFESINLLARISKTGDADHGVVTEVEQRAFGKGEQVDVAANSLFPQDAIILPTQPEAARGTARKPDGHRTRFPSLESARSGPLFTRCGCPQVEPTAAGPKTKVFRQCGSSSNESL
jgi:hypothetical protein